MNAPKKRLFTNDHNINIMVKKINICGVFVLYCLYYSISANIAQGI